MVTSFGVGIQWDMKGYHQQYMTEGCVKTGDLVPFVWPFDGEIDFHGFPKPLYAMGIPHFRSNPQGAC